MSDALLNARYIAIRTAEAKGLTDRLLQASRDRTPGVRQLLVPLLYRYWHNNRSDGWNLVQNIAQGAVRFPGLVDRHAIEILGELSMPILNQSRGQADDLARLAEIWQSLFARMLGSPIARTARVLGRDFVLRRAARPLSDVLKRQPSYQPVNYQELAASLERPPQFRDAWRRALDCLERPEHRPDAIEQTLMQTDLPFDLYLMLAGERALICHGAQHPADVLAMLERLFHAGCPWFRHSILYVLFHVFSHQTEVQDDWLDRYDLLAIEFFQSDSWRLTTAAAKYAMPGHTANADVVAARHRPGRPPRVVPFLLRHAIEAGDQGAVNALFAAIDGVAFYHGDGALALALIETAYVLDRDRTFEDRVITALASVRVLDQPRVDAILDQRRVFGRITQADVAGKAPSIVEEDLLTLVDGFIIHMMITSDGFRARFCDLFRRALVARNADECLLQVLEWIRDQLA
jgi:hypothetical protein